MDEILIFSKILNCNNSNKLNNLYDLYYNDGDEDIKEAFCDKETILFNRECLNKDNYPRGYIGGGDVDKFLQLEIDFKYNKLKKNYTKMINDQKIKNLIIEYNNNERERRNE